MLYPYAIISNESALFYLSLSLHCLMGGRASLLNDPERG